MNIKSATELLNRDYFHLVKIANEIRNKKNDKNRVKYHLETNINYTNYCLSKCKFCAFHTKDTKKARRLTEKEILQKVEYGIKKGASRVLMQAGLDDKYAFKKICRILKSIKKNFNIKLHCFSPPEIYFFSIQENKSIEYILKKLIESGLDSLPGGGAELLIDKYRKKYSKNKASSKQWIEVIRTAAKLGLKSSATMVIGFGENWYDRLLHLKKIRALQQETNVFEKFIPWIFYDKNTLLENKFERIRGFEYLKLIAIARIFLDNIRIIQVSRLTVGNNIACVALNCGADDIGGILIEENVVKSAGVNNEITESQIRALIKQAGKIPQKVVY